MDSSVKEKPMADLRDYLAEERTFLAWIRTGIALMGFGLLVAHFELFADEPRITQHASGVHPHWMASLWFGTALVAIGVAVNLFSAWRYMRLPLQARDDRGSVPGAARNRHDDLPTFDSGAAG
jgi:putative membrane protein